MIVREFGCELCQRSGGIFVAAFGRKSDPLVRLHEIRLHALAQSQKHPQSHLSFGVALLRRSGQPFESFGWIGRTTFPLEQHYGEV